MTDSFDLVVIGAGSGGVRAARMSASMGARVAIVEGRFFGGTCVNVGCVPKKMFSYAAEFPEQVALARDYGFDWQTSPVNWPRLKANKDKEITRLNGIYRRLLDQAGVSVYEGYAQVLGDGQVRVGEQVLQAERVLVATGGKPFLPEVPGIEHASISDDLFELEQLPARVAVVGGGYIACEFASILAGLGCAVTQLYRGELFLRGFDADIRAFMAEQMPHNGVRLRFNTDVTAIHRAVDGLRLDLDDGDSLAVDRVFYATGRVPNVDGLFAGQMPEMAINGALLVDDDYQTSMPGLFAIGDVIDRVQLTPVALAEGMWLARQWFASEKPRRPVEYDFIPTAVFSHPNVGTVGLTQEEALEKHGCLRIYRSAFKPLRYSLGEHSQRSLMKLIVDDATDQVIGLHMAGEGAGEITQGFAVAIRAGLTKDDFDATIGIHPTSAEEFVTLRDAETVSA